MVKDDESGSGDGSLDWKSQDDHPMVKDDESGNGDGTLDWKSQDDHPMVKDDQKEDEDEMDLKDALIAVERAWQDMFSSN